MGGGSRSHLVGCQASLALKKNELLRILIYTIYKDANYRQCRKTLGTTSPKLPSNKSSTCKRKGHTAIDTIDTQPHHATSLHHHKITKYPVRRSTTISETSQLVPRSRQTITCSGSFLSRNGWVRSYILPPGSLHCLHYVNPCVLCGYYISHVQVAPLSVTLLFGLWRVGGR